MHWICFLQCVSFVQRSPLFWGIWRTRPWAYVKAMEMFLILLSQVYVCIWQRQIETEQTHGGGLSIAGGLAQLSTRCKAVCSEVLLLAYFWAFSRTKNQDSRQLVNEKRTSSSLLGVFLFISTDLEFTSLLCPAHLVLYRENVNPVSVYMCFQVIFFTSLSVLLGFDKKSKNPATLVSSSSTTTLSFISS